MLSAESASGQYLLEAVEMMSRIICRTEADPLHRQYVDTVAANMQASGTDAIGTAIRSITAMMPVCATVAFTATGATVLRIAHQRPQRILCLTPTAQVAGRLTVAWGVRPRVSNATGTVEEMVDAAVAACRSDDLVRPGEAVIVTAGVPFGTPGTTNLLRLAGRARPPPESAAPTSPNIEHRTGTRTSWTSSSTRCSRSCTTSSPPKPIFLRTAACSRRCTNARSCSTARCRSGRARRARCSRRCMCVPPTAA